MKKLAIAAALTLGLAVSFCGSPYEIQELERVPSPDGSMDAVIARHDPNGGLGATIPFSWAVYLVCSGCKAEDDYHFLAENAAEWKVSWDHAGQMRISAFNARPFQQKDFVIFQRQKNVRVKYAIENQFADWEQIKRAAQAQGKSLPLQTLAPK